MLDRKSIAPGVPLLGVLLGSCAGVPAALPPTVAQEPAGCAWRVCIEVEDTRDGRSYLVVNREPVPATVMLTFQSMQNLRTDVEFPIERVVPAETRGVLIKLEAVRPGRPVDARPAVMIDLGSAATRPDVEYLYAVPFGGLTPRRIIQGYNGSDTHQLGMRYALDIAMPQGTPILAARGGTVLYIQDGFTEGGRDPDLLELANLVVVAHDDGSMATYGHLSPGIPVSRGDTVQEGDPLGFSGMTGFAGQPHLHFHVGVKLMGDPGRTLPVRLKSRQGDEIFPLEDTLLEPTRSGGSG